jgi:hypothetical protein
MQVFNVMSSLLQIGTNPTSPELVEQVHITLQAAQQQVWVLEVYAARYRCRAAQLINSLEGRSLTPIPLVYAMVSMLRHHLNSEASEFTGEPGGGCVCVRGWVWVGVGVMEE